MDAVARGTADGLALFLNILAMLVVLVALVGFANAILAALPPRWPAPPLTLQRAMGWLFAPLAWSLGLPWAEAALGGALLGTKTALNEFVAYLDFAGQADAFSERSRLILTYALCGFANFGSLGILIGGLGPHGARAQGRDRPARDEIHPRRHLRHLPVRGHRRGAGPDGPARAKPSRAASPPGRIAEDRVISPGRRRRGRGTTPPARRAPHPS